MVSQGQLDYILDTSICKIDNNDIIHLFNLYMIPFNYHHLYYFYIIAREGSISRACEKLHLSQPTLSAQLKQFERYLKINLFKRENKKLILTEEGRHILFYAAEIFDIGNEMTDSLRDISQKGRIKIQIGSSFHVPGAAVEELIRFLIKIEPGVYISHHDTDEDSLREGLKTHQFDLVLSDKTLPAHLEDEIECRLLANSPVYFCSNAALAKKYPKIPQDLHGAPIILPPAQSQIYTAIQEYFVMYNVKPIIIAEIQNQETICRLVQAGTGIALLDKLTISRANNKHGRLVILSQQQHLLNKIYLLTKNRKKKHPLMSKIIENFRI